MLLAGSRAPAARPGNASAFGNTYADDYPMQDDNYSGQVSAQVAYDHSHRFWSDTLGRAVEQSNMRAIVADLLWRYFEHFHDRLNNTQRHEIWMDGFLGQGGASRYRLPVRIDQALPSDHLATAVLNWPAAVSARISGDMDGCKSRIHNCRAWASMASSGAFLAALHLRPTFDVLWTTSVQPGNSENLRVRPHIEHELVIAVLTTGPVGFGDALPQPGFAGTNVSRLLQASRRDGIILKPAHPALRLGIRRDSCRQAASGDTPLGACPEIWAAPCVPAREANSSHDRRANSFVRVQRPSGAEEDADARWWYTLLATDVEAAWNIKLRPQQLFPVPPASLPFVVSRFGRRCESGAPASTCLTAWSAAVPLEVATSPCNGTAGGCRNWNLLHVAPVLAGGWCLVGEQAKIVALSPQRVLVAAPRNATEDEDVSDALHEDELSAGGSGLSFTIIGAAQEVVCITVVRPGAVLAGETSPSRLVAAMAGSVVQVDVTLPASGRVGVRCGGGGAAAGAGCYVVPQGVGPASL